MKNTIRTEMESETVKYIEGDFFKIELEDKMFNYFDKLKNPTFKLVSFDLYSVSGEMEVHGEQHKIHERIDTLEQWYYTVEYNGKEYEARVEMEANSGGGSFSVGFKIGNKWVYKKEEIGEELDKLADDLYSFFYCMDLESVVCIYDFLN